MIARASSVTYTSYHHGRDQRLESLVDRQWEVRGHRVVWTTRTLGRKPEVRRYPLAANAVELWRGIRAREH